MYAPYDFVSFAAFMILSVRDLISVYTVSLNITSGWSILLTATMHGLSRIRMKEEQAMPQNETTFQHRRQFAKGASSGCHRTRMGRRTRRPAADQPEALL